MWYAHHPEMRISERTSGRRMIIKLHHNWRAAAVNGVGRVTHLECMRCCVHRHKLLFRFTIRCRSILNDDARDTHRPYESIIRSLIWLWPILNGVFMVSFQFFQMRTNCMQCCCQLPSIARTQTEHFAPSSGRTPSRESNKICEIGLPYLIFEHTRVCNGAHK